MKSFLLLAWLFLFLVPVAFARSGCCSHHQGVCGCGCCDGTPLSSTCAPYYPQCNDGGGQTQNQNLYIPPTNPPYVPPTRYVYPTATPTLIPTEVESTIEMEASQQITPTAESNGNTIGGLFTMGGLAGAAYLVRRAIIQK